MYKKSWFKWGLVLIWCGLIFFATESPSFTGKNTAQIISKITQNEQVEEKPAQLEERSSGLSLNVLIRKSAHLIGFGILAVLLVVSLSDNRYRYGLAWLLATLYGGFDELHQSITPERTASLLDVGYDSLGAIIALILYKAVSTRKSRAH